MYVHPSIDKDSNYLYKYDNNVEFITCIKSLLTECEHTQGRQNKILVVILQITISNFDSLTPFKVIYQLMIILIIY